MRAQMSLPKGSLQSVGPNDRVPLWMKRITIRGVPEEVRDELAARASLRGQSMQEYLRGELVRLAFKPSVEVWLERVQEGKAVLGTQVMAAETLGVREQLLCGPVFQEDNGVGS